MHYNKFRQIKALMDRCDAEREGRSGAAADLEQAKTEIAMRDRGQVPS